MAFLQLPAAQAWQYFTRTVAQGVTAGIQIKTGIGMLHCVTINTNAATAVITLFDNTSAAAPEICQITGASTNPITLIYDVNYGTGLFIVIATAAVDLTVSFA